MKPRLPRDLHNINYVVQVVLKLVSISCEQWQEISERSREDCPRGRNGRSAVDQMGHGWRYFVS